MSSPDFITKEDDTVMNANYESSTPRLQHYQPEQVDDSAQTNSLTDPALHQEMVLGSDESLKRILSAWDRRTFQCWRSFCEAYNVSHVPQSFNSGTEDLLPSGFLQKNNNSTSSTVPTAPRAILVSQTRRLARRMSDSECHDHEGLEQSATTQIADILYIKSRVATELHALEQLRQELEDCEVSSEVHLKLEAAMKENTNLRKKMDEFRNKLWDLAQHKMSKDRELEELREQHDEMVARLKQQHEAGMKSLQRKYEEDKVDRTTSVLRALSQSTALGLGSEIVASPLKTPSAGSFSQYSALVVISDDEDDDFDLGFSAARKAAELPFPGEGKAKRTPHASESSCGGDESPDESMAPDSLADVGEENVMSRVISFTPTKVDKETVPPSPSQLRLADKSSYNEVSLTDQSEENPYVAREFYQRVVDEMQSLRELLLDYEARYGKLNKPRGAAPTKPSPISISFSPADDDDVDGLSEKLRLLNAEVEQWDVNHVTAQSSPRSKPQVRPDHSIENWTYTNPIKGLDVVNDTCANVSEISSSDEIGFQQQTPQRQTNNNAPISPPAAHSTSSLSSSSSSSSSSSPIGSQQNTGVNTDLTLSGSQVSLEAWHEALAKVVADIVIQSAVHCVEQEKVDRKLIVDRGESLSALETERDQLTEKVNHLKEELQLIQQAHEEKMRKLRENYECQLDEKALELRQQIERLESEKSRLAEFEDDSVRAQLEELRIMHQQEITHLTEEHQRELDRIESEYQLQQRVSEVNRKKQVNDLEVALRTALEMKERTDALEDEPSGELSQAAKLLQASFDKDASMDASFMLNLHCLLQTCRVFSKFMSRVEEVKCYQEDWEGILSHVQSVMENHLALQEKIPSPEESLDEKDSITRLPNLMKSICQQLKTLLAIESSPPSTQRSADDLYEVERNYQRRQAHNENLLSQLQAEVDALHEELHTESAKHQLEVEDFRSQLASAHRQQKALERFVEEQTRDRELEREDYERELSALRIQRQQMQQALREKRRSVEKPPVSEMLNKSTSVGLTVEDNFIETLQNEHQRVLQLLEEKENLIQTFNQHLLVASQEEGSQVELPLLENGKMERLQSQLSETLKEVVCLREEVQQLHRENRELREKTEGDVYGRSAATDASLRLTNEKLVTMVKEHEHLKEKHEFALQELEMLRKPLHGQDLGKVVNAEPRETFGSRCSAVSVATSWHNSDRDNDETDLKKEVERLCAILKEKEAEISELETLLVERKNGVGQDVVTRSSSERMPAVGQCNTSESRAMSSALSFHPLTSKQLELGGLENIFLSQRVQSLLERIHAEGQHLLNLSDEVDFINAVPQMPYRSSLAADGCEAPGEDNLERRRRATPQEERADDESSVTLPPLTATKSLQAAPLHSSHSKKNDVTITATNTAPMDYSTGEEDREAVQEDCLEKERRALVAATCALKELLSRIEQWHRLRAYANDPKQSGMNGTPRQSGTATSGIQHGTTDEDWRLSLLLAVQEAYTTDRELCATRLESLLRSVGSVMTQPQMHNISQHNRHEEMDDEQDTLNDVNELPHPTPLHPSSSVQPPWLVLRDLLLQWQRQHQVALDRLYATDRQSLLAEIAHLRQQLQGEEFPLHPIRASSPLRQDSYSNRSRVSTHDVAVSCADFTSSRDAVTEIQRLRQQVDALTCRAKHAEEVSEEMRAGYLRENLLNEGLREDRERLRRTLEDTRLRLSSTESRLSECRESLEAEQKLRFESLQSVEERRRSASHLQHEIERVRREFTKCQNELNEEKTRLIDEKRKAEILERELLLIIDRYKDDLRKEQQTSETERELLQQRITALQRDIEAVEKRASMSVKSGQELRDRALEENRLLTEKNLKLQALLEQKTLTSIAQLREFEQLQRQVKRLRDDIDRKSAEPPSRLESIRDRRSMQQSLMSTSITPHNDVSSRLGISREFSTPAGGGDVAAVQQFSKYLEDLLFRVDQLQFAVEELMDNLVRRETTSLSRQGPHGNKMLSHSGVDSDVRSLQDILQQVSNLRVRLQERPVNGHEVTVESSVGSTPSNGLSVATLQYMVTECRTKGDHGAFSNLELLPWEILFLPGESHLTMESSVDGGHGKWQGPQLVYLLATMSTAQLQTQILLQGSERSQLSRVIETLEQRVAEFAHLEQTRRRHSNNSRVESEPSSQRSCNLVPERLPSQHQRHSPTRVALTVYSDSKTGAANTSPKLAVNMGVPLRQMSPSKRNVNVPTAKSSSSMDQGCPTSSYFHLPPFYDIFDSPQEHEEMHLRCLRAESRCRALAFQKRYLVLLLKQPHSFDTFPILPSNSSVYPMEDAFSPEWRHSTATHLTLLQRFRAAVCVVAAIWRMRFQVKKWRFTANYFGLDDTQLNVSTSRINSTVVGTVAVQTVGRERGSSPSAWPANTNINTDRLSYSAGSRVSSTATVGPHRVRAHSPYVSSQGSNMARRTPISQSGRHSQQPPCRSIATPGNNNSKDCERIGFT